VTHAHDAAGFVPDSFEPPRECVGNGFVLLPLTPEHNERDHAAWTSSLDHIRGTPGFAHRRWPHPMSLEQNLGDLERHATDFRERRGFTFTVLPAPDADEVIGCVYIYPGTSPRSASVRSWVRADHASLDRPLYERVRQWLEESWPFERIEYAARREE
jgi:hypothetical protein